MSDTYFAWESLWHVGWLVLAVVLAVAVFRYHRRNKANDALTEEGTRAFREDPEHYDEKRTELMDRVRPPD